jgi:hypothetical protein
MSSPKFFPVFEQLRFEPESATTDSIEVPVRGGRFAKLISFNAVETSKIIAEAKKQLGEPNSADKDLLSEHIRQNIADIALKLRVEAEGSTIQMPAQLKTHSGFIAKVLLSNPANPIQTKEKEMKVIALSREGADEKKKLLTAAFETVLSAAARLNCAPEKLGAMFDNVCPADPLNVGSHNADLGQALGGAMGAMGEQMGNLMGGLAGAMGGAGGGAGGPECKQQ